MELLYSCSIRRGNLDSLCWRPSSRKIFQVRFYYSILIQPSRNSFPWRSVWKSKVPTSVAFFSWTAILGRILTIDNLRKQWVLIIDWYCMCKSNGEFVNHLLLHCPTALELWNLIFTLFGTYRWCLGEWLIYLLVGLVKWGILNLELFGRLSLIALCGAHGARETLELSLGRSNRFQLSNSPSLQTLFE